MFRQLLVVASLCVAACSACSGPSYCACQDPGGNMLCKTPIKGTTNSHDCAGYCRDRACLGTIIGTGIQCRVWKGYCKSEFKLIKTPYCNEGNYDNCAENFDCPGQ